MKAYLSTKHSTGDKTFYSKKDTPENTLLDWDKWWLLWTVGGWLIQWPTVFNNWHDDPSPDTPISVTALTHPKGTVVTLVQP